MFSTVNILTTTIILYDLHDSEKSPHGTRKGKCFCWIMSFAACRRNYLYDSDIDNSKELTQSQPNSALKRKIKIILKEVFECVIYRLLHGTMVIALSIRWDVPVGVPLDLSTLTVMSCIGTYGENCRHYVKRSCFISCFSTIIYKCHEKLI